jgi:hypothetical protein
MDNTVGLLSALGADCWTGREFVQPRLNPRWARVFLSISLSITFAAMLVDGLFLDEIAGNEVVAQRGSPARAARDFPVPRGVPVTAGEVPSRIGS